MVAIVGDNFTGTSMPEFPFGLFSPESGPPAPVRQRRALVHMISDTLGLSVGFSQTLAVGWRNRATRAGWLKIVCTTGILRGAAWPQIPVLAERTAAAGFVLRERLAIYPEFSSRPEFVGARVQSELRKLRCENGYARKDS